MKTKSSEMKISQLLPSMKETVGEMDSRFGYSSRKICAFFETKFPPRWFKPYDLKPDQLTDEHILTRVTENLLLLDHLKRMLDGFYSSSLNSKELDFLYQYFADFDMHYFIENSFDLHSQFLDDFDKYGKINFSSDLDEQNEFLYKIIEMDPFAFCVFIFLLNDFWNHIPSPIDNPIAAGIEDEDYMSDYLYL
jgi:hypothetical protein